MFFIPPVPTWAKITCTAKADPHKLADQAFEALTQNDYGQYDDLISVLTPALGREGLEHLKQRMVELRTRPFYVQPKRIG